ncbi:endothelial protein C receptor [Hemicordylus capensis]|uniref:endothelial protein C receptor n=1 Tax=Hemicordylus capensis TaxID=884348 RepID=UPI002304ACA8|nr:endothelial protein C receptor [Hemicordylus capensis]XP_053164027.1 endothelial protein C receptor [Hemicordylus capensis]
MLLFQALLLPWLLCHWADSADSHTFTMFYLAHFPNSSFVEFIGNATLDGKLTHSMEGGNEQLNVSQRHPLEPSHVWEQRVSNLSQYLQKFQQTVQVLTLERKVPYPLQVQCTKECLLFNTGATNSSSRVVLNGIGFLRFQTDSASWIPLQDTPLASFASSWLNKYNETTISIKHFLQETCIGFLREHTDVKGSLTGKQKGRSHTSLVLGITLGALALMGLTVCIFICTGGKR